MKGRLFILLFVIPISFIQGKAQVAHEWHVSKKGRDAGAGNAKAPFLTIQHAADQAQPGDKVIIHTGVYREEVLLKNGGRSESERISFIAAGESVTIKGSEPVRSWKKQSGGVWKADLSTVENGFDPFVTLVSDKAAIHLGEVYVDGVSYKEQATQDAVSAAQGRWFASNAAGVTSIWVNFGNIDPTKKLVEVNRRAAAFLPAKAGINFITISGINITQVASKRASIDGEQPAAISTGGGMHWVIQNCTLTDIKCVAISLAQPGGHDLSRNNYNRPAFGEFENINTVGHHIVRNNLIRRCGQAGILGLVHGTLSEIYNNQIENINANEGLAEDEVAGIYLAVAVDAIVKGNLVYNISNGCGIKLGPLYQGTRITRNTIANVKGHSLYFFRSHGLALIDNNVISNANTTNITLRSAEANVFAHNLFSDCIVSNQPIDSRAAFGTINYRPHSLVTKQTIPATTLDNKWFRNIFIRKGLDTLRHDHGESDYNIYLAGAGKTKWSDEHSITSQGDKGFGLSFTQPGARINFDLSSLPRISGPVIDTGFVGRFALSQSIEEPDGKPVRLDNDFFGHSIAALPGITGPFAVYPNNNTKTAQLFVRRLIKEVIK